MGFLYTVRDIHSVDVWRNGQDIDTRMVVEVNSFLAFLYICEALRVPCLEVLDSELVVDGKSE